VCEQSRLDISRKLLIRKVLDILTRIRNEKRVCVRVSDFVREDRRRLVRPAQPDRSCGRYRYQTISF
jgi:hypothetical protein